MSEFKVHTGKHCPVHPDTFVEVILGSGSNNPIRVRAGDVEWRNGHANQSGNGIQYYRVIDDNPLRDRLILVRHGQSTGNSDPWFYQQPDSAVCLTEKGVRQAINCGEILKRTIGNRNIGLMAFSSQYTRAKQTARIVLDVMGSPGTEVTSTPFLNERGHGTGEEVKGLYDNAYLARPGGESLLDIRQRVGNWLEANVLPLLSFGNVILFSHAHCLAGVIGYITGSSDEKMTEIRVNHAEPMIFRRKHLGYGGFEKIELGG